MQLHCKLSSQDLLPTMPASGPSSAADAGLRMGVPSAQGESAFLLTIASTKPLWTMWTPSQHASVDTSFTLLT